MKIINEEDPDEKAPPDFSEWNWGDDHEPIVKVFCDQVATVLWQQMKTDIEANWRYPRFTTTATGKPAMILWLLESHSLVIRLDEIVMPEGEDLENELDAEDRQQMIAIFKDWIAALEEDGS